MRDHDEADPFALARLEPFPLRDVVEAPHERTVDVRAVVIEDPLLPLAEMRRTDPDRVVDRVVDEALRPVIDETVLARPRAEALAEQQDLRPRLVRTLRTPLRDRLAQHPRVQPSLLDTVEREGRGRAEYCIATLAQSPRVRNSRIDGRGVVDVAGTGRRSNHQPRPIECARTLELAHRESTRSCSLGALSRPT